MGWGCETTAKGLRAKLKFDRDCGGNTDLFRDYRRLQIGMRVQYRGGRPLRSHRYNHIPEIPIGTYGRIDMYGFEHTGSGNWRVRFDGYEHTWSVYEGDLRIVSTTDT